MIPPPDHSGHLPPGVHWATWDEFAARFGTTPWRLELLAGLHRAATSLRSAGCRTLYVDGSFITTKKHPGDYDGCWDPTGVEFDQLDPTLLKFEPPRAAQKAKFLGELFPSTANADPFSAFFLFFQRTRNGQQKGIVALDLRRLS
jgi:hypothetical protein